MNTDPLTEAEIERVLELDAKATTSMDILARMKARYELSTICPRLARELLATREKLRVAREAIAHVLNGGKGREVFPPSDEWHGESFAIVSAALTHQP